eukprot:gene973-1150_t
MGPSPKAKERESCWACCITDPGRCADDLQVFFGMDPKSAQDETFFEGEFEQVEFQREDGSEMRVYDRQSLRDNPRISDDWNGANSSGSAGPRFSDHFHSMAVSASNTETDEEDDEHREMPKLAPVKKPTFKIDRSYTKLEQSLFSLDDAHVEDHQEEDVNEDRVEDMAPDSLYSVSPTYSGFVSPDPTNARSVLAPSVKAPISEASSGPFVSEKNRRSLKMDIPRDVWGKPMTFEDFLVHFPNNNPDTNKPWVSMDNARYFWMAFAEFHYPEEQVLERYEREATPPKTEQTPVIGGGKTPKASFRPIEDETVETPEERSKRIFVKKQTFLDRIFGEDSVESIAERERLQFNQKNLTDRKRAEREEKWRLRLEQEQSEVSHLDMHDQKTYQIDKKLERESEFVDKLASMKFNDPRIPGNENMNKNDNDAPWHEALLQKGSEFFGGAEAEKSVQDNKEDSAKLHNLSVNTDRTERENSVKKRLEPETPFSPSDLDKRKQFETVEKPEKQVSISKSISRPEEKEDKTQDFRCVPNYGPMTLRKYLHKMKINPKTGEKWHKKEAKRQWERYPLMKPVEDNEIQMKVSGNISEPEELDDIYDQGTCWNPKGNRHGCWNYGPRNPNAFKGIGRAGGCCGTA